MRSGRRAVRSAALGAVLAVAVACGGDEPVSEGACPSGTRPVETVNELVGPGEDTRDAAIRAELRDLGLDASDDAIVAAVIAATPGTGAGTEVVRIETDDGSAVTMTLAPLDPGWAVGASSRCVHDDAVSG